MDANLGKITMLDPVPTHTPHPEYEVQGLFHHNLLPFMGVQYGLTRTGDNGHEYAIFTYQAYNAMGLIGSEMNGVAVCDQDAMQVITAGIRCQPSGWFGASKQQVEICDWLADPEQCSWSMFVEFLNGTNGLRREIET